MILQASLIGGWEKLELWDHTHLALLGLFTMICVLEVILLKMTTSAGLFTRLHHHYDDDYDDAGEYEEDVYYEDLSTDYDLRNRQQIRYGHWQQDAELIQQQIPIQYSRNNNYNHQTSDENNHFFHNNYQSTTTNVFRFVY